MSNFFHDSVGLSVHALLKNKVRTGLSILGTAIGIASIVVILSAGVSLTKIFEGQLETFGTDYIQVEIKIPNTSQASTENAAGQASGISVTTLTLDDKEDFDKLANVEATYGAVIGQASISSAYGEKRLNYFAVTHEFDQVDPAVIERGRFFSDEEDTSLAPVAVIGRGVADDLFPNQDPVGQQIRIQKVRFRVIGVYETRGATGFINLDDFLFLPLRTAQKRLLGYEHLAYIYTQLHDVTRDDETAAEITAILRDNHDITDPAKDDFAVTTQADANELIGSILNGVTMVLAIIASIALLVGGVGIMNIMYVAVSERVFEIGLRKAVGASRARIRSQFLFEAIMITFGGGVFGVLGALAMLLLLFVVAPLVGFDWPFAVSIPSVILGVVFSSAVGLIFGYFPAKAAAELHPVDALTRRGS